MNKHPSHITISRRSTLLLLWSLLAISCDHKEVQISIRTRTDWAPAKIAYPAKAAPMGGVNRITIHHDGLDPIELKTEDAVKKRLVSIRNEHVRKNWADIGYHYIVDPMGQVWEGRPIRYQGAHVSGHNAHNIGILVLGNFEKQKPSHKALHSLAALVEQLRSKYKIPLNQVFTHGELGNTECPGHHLQQAVNRLRR